MSVTSTQAVEKSLVQKILEHPLGHEWTLQGLGMLRLYLDDKRRMHIWDDRFKAENVSEIHTHPWNFKSTIVAGIVRNQICIEAQGSPVTHWKQSIFCGAGGGLEGIADRVRLMESEYQTYNEGDIYSELAHEIHVSTPERGTVTIVEREFLQDSDHAFVYWEGGAHDWVSAEPRPAEPYEVISICDNSLATWFK
jgi:hypothetical protein